MGNERKVHKANTEYKDVNSLPLSNITQPNSSKIKKFQNASTKTDPKQTSNVTKEHKANTESKNVNSLPLSNITLAKSIKEFQNAISKTDHEVLSNVGKAHKANTEPKDVNSLLLSTFTLTESSKIHEVQNSSSKRNHSENIDVKKLETKLAETEQKLIECDSKLDSQWMQYMSRQDRLTEELKTKTQQVEEMKHVLSEVLRKKGRKGLKAFGFRTEKPQKGETKAYSQLLRSISWVNK